MFTSRSGSQGNPKPPPPQSIEAVRRRARHRLIGAVVLVLLGVLGFPLLFDTQPRPISVDIPIVIPAKTAGQPPIAPKAAAPAPKPVDAAGQPVPGKSAPSGSVSASESLSGREEVVDAVPSAARPQVSAKKEDVSVPRVEPAPPAKAEPVAKPDNTDAARARALLEGKSAEKPDAVPQRIVVQVGAFADAARASEVRQKLERAGLKTYTHVAETADGKRIRVRVGPFATQAEAARVAAQVKALGLPAAILTL